MLHPRFVCSRLPIAASPLETGIALYVMFGL